MLLEVELDGLGYLGRDRHEILRAVPLVGVEGLDRRDLGGESEVGEDHREVLEDLRAIVGLVLVRPEPLVVEADHDRLAVVDEHLAVAIEDASPRPLLVLDAKVDRPCLLEHLRLVDHLQVPEAREQRREEREADDADDGDPHLRRVDVTHRVAPLTLPPTGVPALRPSLPSAIRTATAAPRSARRSPRSRRGADASAWTPRRPRRRRRTPARPMRSPP